MKYKNISLEIHIRELAEPEARALRNAPNSLTKIAPELPKQFESCVTRQSIEPLVYQNTLAMKYIKLGHQ
jgi:hypothetical protein